MIRARGRAALCAGAIAALGCGQGAPSGSAPAPASRGLEAGVVARVGARAIAASSVGRIAAAQQIDPAAARDLAVRDALLAEGASARGLDRSLDVALTERALLARRLLHAIRAEAERAEITEQELAAAAERRWLDVDRPEGLRTIHAVVRFDASAPEETRNRAIALAEAIRAAALPLADKAADLPLPAGAAARQEDALATAFQRAIDPITKGDHGGLQVRVEPLPEIAADGRVLAPGGEMFDPVFARAAAALGRRGEISPVTVTSFGAHVILLLERTPPVRLAAEERRRLLREDIVTGRARAAEDALLAGLRGRSARENDADALLALVAVEP